MMLSRSPFATASDAYARPEIVEDFAVCTQCNYTLYVYVNTLRHVYASSYECSAVVYLQRLLACSKAVNVDVVTLCSKA